MIDKNSRIYVAGHRGFIGSAVVRQFRSAGFQNLCLPAAGQLDLRSSPQVNAFFERTRPEVVVMCASVGSRSDRSAGGLEDDFSGNYAMGDHVIEAADFFEVKRMIYVANFEFPQRVRPSTFDEARVVEWFSTRSVQGAEGAKVLCAQLLEALHLQHGSPFVSVFPCQLYGSRARYSFETRSELSVLLWKLHRAALLGENQVRCPEDGYGVREMLHVDDFARAILFLLHEDVGDPMINIGSGQMVGFDLIVRELCEVVGYRGSVRQVSGTRSRTRQPRLDSSKIHRLGWYPQISLRTGLTRLYRELGQRLGEDGGSDWVPSGRKKGQPEGPRTDWGREWKRL